MNSENMPIWWYCLLVWRLGFFVGRANGCGGCAAKFWVDHVYPPYEVPVVSHTGDVIQ